MSRILFIQPPDIHAAAFDVAVAKRKRYLNYPPYGLGLLAAIAERDGHECRIANLQTAVLTNAQTPEPATYALSWKMELLFECTWFPPDLICITCMFSQTHKSLMAVSEYLRTICPDILQMSGGVHITNSLMQEETRQKFLDDLPEISEFMMYECDSAFRERLRGNFYQCVIRSALEPDGLKWFGEKVAPDTLDMPPAWHLMDPRKSSAVGKVGAFYFLRGDPVTATVLSNRGCRAHCTFCSVRNFNGEGVRRRSADSVVEELLLLQEHYGVQHIMWLDDDLFFDRKSTLQLFNQMVKRGVKLTWDASNGVIAASCTREILDAATSSGCIGLILGMESGNPDILRQIRKPGTVRHFIRAAEELRNFENLHARVFLMIGFPGETLRQIKDTLDVAREMDLDWYNIAPLQALPNTPIYKSANPTDFTEIMFNSGPHSRVAQKAGGSPWLLDFKHAFDDLDRVPTVAELDGIWAYMNYHLNYDRLQRETRPVKLAMQQRYVEHICDLIAPDNAFAMHYSKVLSRKLGQAVTRAQEERLDAVLTNPYWRQRFEDFHLLEKEIA